MDESLAGMDRAVGARGGIARSRVPESADLDELDGAATLDALEETRRAELAAGMRRLALVARWAELNGPERVRAAEQRRLAAGVPWSVIEKTREKLAEAGGDGTPLVGEFGADELGCALHVSTAAAGYLLADAMDLRHRHPLLWALVQELEVPSWVACQVVRRTRAAGLTLDQARWVDARTAAKLPPLTQGRALGLVDAAIIAADPPAAEDRRRARAARRFASPGRAEEDGENGGSGLRSFLARTWSGEVTRFDAMVTRLAQILADNGDTDPVDVRRAKAFTVLATPAYACRLLADAARKASERAQRAEQAVDDATEDGTEAPASASDGAAGGVEAHAEPEPEPEPADEQTAVQAAAAVGRWLSGVDLASLLPPAMLYVHLTDTSARQGADGAGVARVEDPTGTTKAAGFATTLLGLRDLLGHCRVTVRPVLDPDGLAPVDGYEHTPLMREAIALRTPVEVFPYGSTPTRRTDLDHSTPYVAMDRGGPPGQTHPDNTGPLGRHHHRVRTHARGWRHAQPLPGLYYWRTPHGHWYVVDDTGTRHLGTTTPLLVAQMTERARPTLEHRLADTIAASTEKAG